MAICFELLFLLLKNVYDAVHIKALMRERESKMPDKGLSRRDFIVGGALTGAAAIGAASILTSCAPSGKGSGAAATVKMEPGKYTASYVGHWGIWETPVTITVNETAITAIDVPTDRTQYGDTEKIFDACREKLVPRIIESQSYAVDAVSGATISSLGVKQAVKSALEQALEAGGSEPNAIEAFNVIPPKPEEGQTEEMDVDVLVVGLGSFGIIAMKRAREAIMKANGMAACSVWGIDKAGYVGGQSLLTHEMNAVNPPHIVAAQNGIPLVDYNDYLGTWFKDTTGADGTLKCKEEMVRLFFDNSGLANEYLDVEQGWEFGTVKDTNDFSESNYAVVFNYFSTNMIDIYSESNENRRAVKDTYHKKMLAEVKATGGGFLLETEGYELIFDVASNTVKGVKARNNVTGKEYVINAKAVLISTGGFGGSSELMNSLLDSRWAGDWKQNGATQNDGKMIKAGLDIGAGTYNIDMSPVTMEISLPKYLTHFPINFVEGKITARTGRQSTWTYNDIPLWMCVSINSFAVDKDGNRFGNEYAIANGIGTMMPPNAWKVGPYFYSVWSQEQVDKLMAEGFTAVKRTAAYCQQGGFELNVPTPEVQEALDASIEAAIAWKGDTIEALANEIGAEPAKLSAAVDRYNELCAKGSDDDFGKDVEYLVPIGAGPYYAIKAMPVMYGTCGGFDVDTQFRVLKEDHKTPINGFYAIGQDSFGVLCSNEINYLAYGGVCQGYGMTSAFMAGDEAGEYASML
jgi:fumarate reductase flavoprotein subunit